MRSFGGPILVLGKVAGIPIKVHWTFSLLLLFIGYIAYSNQIPEEDLVWFFGYVFLLFAFVIMHEYGHALTARKFGITTRDIIISPIGGIARLERLPENPRQELLIAVAGPAVNVVLAIFFLIVQLIISNEIIPTGDRINFGSITDFVGYLLVINIVLVVFNMIPAFPMDGGRVLRAVMAMIINDRLKATRWAVWIGQTIAMAFLLGGIMWDHYMLIFIGIFVFLTARAEYSQMKLMHRMNQAVVKEIMRQDYTVLRADDSLDKAIAITDQKNFLISDPFDNIIGALPGIFVEEAIKNKQTQMLVKDHMTRSFGSVFENVSLSQAFTIMNDRGWAIAEVIDMEGNKKGVIDRKLLLDFMHSK